MQQIDFHGKKVTVMGIGLHGGAVEMIKWLLKQGTRVIATDMKSGEDLAPSLEKLKGLKNLTIVIGQHRMEDFERVDMVIKNPAVRWDNKYIKAALAKKIPVEMDVSLFFKLCPSKKIIGITGTKGKTTTSSFIFEILKTAGKKVVKVGIGQEAVMNKLALVDKDTWVVFELSSWRLSAVGRAKISPHIAVVTNIYPDHLNYYKDMAEYINDKKYIFRHQGKQDYVILNGDNETTRKMKEEIAGKCIFFSHERMDGEPNNIYIDNHKFHFESETPVHDFLDSGGIKLKGDHNMMNALAAAAAGIVAGINPPAIAKAITGFTGNPHRMEWVRTIDDVKYYNDTAATTPESAMVAIDAFEEPVNLICGGSNKNLDLTQLGKKIAAAETVKRIFLLQGAATEGLRKLIEDNNGQGKIIGVFENMDAAVKAASEQSQSGEVVLLSPGCASFGMFQNEFDRGDKFKKAVAGL